MCVAAIQCRQGGHPIGVYLARSTLVSSYGRAGSLVVLLVWIYCAVQFLLFGASVADASATRPA
ncbi:MAG TPA: hypothetical protein VN709_05390 [Terriglobales bacterium]|nr:hypothetical protein [Terriglobales bacterium]